MGQIDVPAVRPRKRVDVDRWGERVLAKHFPDLLRQPAALNVLELVDVILPRDYGIDCGIARLPVGVEGICEPPNTLELSEEVYDGLVAGDPRSRFTGAHEAVHALLHISELHGRFQSSSRVKLYRRAELPAFRDPEWQANRGAAALLMPYSMVYEVLSDSHPAVAVDRVAATFQVSYEAASYRVDDARQRRLPSRPRRTCGR